MSILMELAMFPTDKGGSVSKYVSKIIKMIDESGVEYKLTPMGTIVETEKLQDALQILHHSYQLLEPDCERVYCTAKFDIRKGRDNCINGKIKSIEEKIGKVKK